MASISKGRYTFFRVGPAEQGKAYCFAIQRGETGRRFDVVNHRPDVRARIASLLELPTERLGALTDLCYRYPTFSGIEYQKSGVLVLKGENINRDGEIILSKEQDYITNAVHAQFPRTQLNPGDLIVSVRGEVGKVGLIPAAIEEANINANTIRIALNQRAKGVEFESRFIWSFLNSQIGRLLIRQYVTGGVQETITAPELLEVRIPRLELHRQQELADFMDQARGSHRAKLDEADALLSSYDQFLLDTLGLSAPPRDDRRTYAISRRDAIRTTKLGPDYHHPERVLTVRALQSLGGDVKAASLSALVNFPHQIVRTPGEVYLSLSHVQSNTGELSNSTDTASGNCILFQENDVLFAGLRPYLNKVYRAEMSGTCSPEFYVLRVRDAETLLPDYLAAVLRSRLVLAQTMHMMTGNTHPRLAEDDVESLMIPVAPPNVQRAIADEVYRRRTEARRLRAEADVEWTAAKQRFEDALLNPQASLR